MSIEYFEAKNIEELCAFLGLPKSQAPKVEMRRDLVIAIRKMLEERQLTHAAASKITGASRTMITTIANGNVVDFTCKNRFYYQVPRKASPFMGGDG